MELITLEWSKPTIYHLIKFLQNGHYEATHFLCYYYYGGMIYAALKNWGRAVYFFEVVSIVIAFIMSLHLLYVYILGTILTKYLLQSWRKFEKAQTNYM